MSSRSATRALPKWLIPAALIMMGATLGGCAGGPNYQDSIANVAQDSQFTLPRGEDSGAPIAGWESVLIVCPYSNTADSPEPFTKEARRLNTSSNDSIQWLLFADGNKVNRVSVDRTSIDFCLDGAVNNAYQHTQLWNAKKSDGGWLVSAVDPA